MKIVSRTFLVILSLLLLSALLPMPTGGADPVELVNERTRNGKKFDLGSNRYAVEVSTGPVHYRNNPTDEGEPWKDIDNYWYGATAPWDWEMTGDGYNTRALLDFTAGQILEFTSQGQYVRFQPMGLRWTNIIDQIDPISNPTDVPVSTVDGRDIVWDGAYGPDTSFKWENQPGRLKKILTLSSPLRDPAAYILASPDPALELEFILDPSAVLDVLVNGSYWNRRDTIASVQTIEFQISGETIFSFVPATVMDSSNDPQTGDLVATTLLRRAGNNLYLSVRVPYFWLQTAVYPVLIDPTIDLQVGAGDGDSMERESDGATYPTLTYGQLKSAAAGSDRYWTGARWTGSFFSSGDTIDVCYVQFYVPGTTNDDVKGEGHFEDGASPAAFSSSSYDISLRSRSTASALWDATSLGVGWAQTPSLVSPCQEIADSYSPTAMVFIGKPYSDVTRNMSWRTYEFDTSLAPKLHIEYTAAGAGPDVVRAFWW